MSQGLDPEVARAASSPTASEVTALALRPAAWVLAALFAVLAAVDHFGAAEQHRFTMVATNLGVSAVVAVIAVGIQRRWIPVSASSAVAAVLTVLASIPILSSLAITADPAFVNHLAVLTVAVGYGILDRRWLALTLGVIGGSFGAIVWHLGHGPALQTAGITLLAAVAASGLINKMRRAGVRDTHERRASLVAAHDALAERSEQLREALDDVQRKATEAEAANVAKSQFLATMSHEIRTPLTGILGTIELMRRDPSPQGQAEHLATLETAGANLLGVLTDVLDLSRIEAGHTRNEPRPFRLRQALEEAVLPFTEAAADKGLRLAWTVSDELPQRLVADPQSLRQIVINLISNAVKFTPSGHVAVRALPGPTPESLMVEVQDSGIGIPDDAAGKLFTPFTQVDGSGTREFGGTGLGLAISRGLAEAAGGSLELVPAPVPGSTFRLVIPYEVDDASGVFNLPDTTPPTAAPGQRVLVVDDQDLTRAVVLRQLQSAGVDAVAASSGEEALKFLQCGHDFTAVLMDCQMPKMDGFEATRRIRTREAAADAPRVPIVALTANAMLNVASEVTEAGMDGLVTKPARTSALLEALEAHRAS